MNIGQRWNSLGRNTRMAVCASLWVGAVIGFGVAAEKYKKRLELVPPQQPTSGLFVCTNGISEVTTALPATSVRYRGDQEYSVVTPKAGPILYYQAHGEACLPRVMYEAEWNQLYRGSMAEEVVATPRPQYL